MMNGADGAQTAIFHAASQVADQGMPITRVLVERGADLTLRVKLPGHYERPGEIVECTTLGYAMRFRHITEARTIAFLQKHGAPE